uniref:LTI65/LTI78 PGEED repeat domain-containing protein n=1 Tax=Oryza punctata TaxID=4537 RepID=A0A0E0JDY7_ORYPU
MNEIRKLKRGISTKRGDHPVQNGATTILAFATGTTGESDGITTDPKWEPEEAVQTTAAARSTTMQTTDPQAQLDIPIPRVNQHVHLRFESEMKEASEMLRESKQLRVNTTRPKTVTFAPILEQGPEPVKNDWHSKELSETATEIFSHAYAIVYEAVLRMVSIIQDAMSSYNIDRRQMLEKIISFNRYLMLKLAPGEGDKVLSEVITEAVLDMFDAWCENVERPLIQRAKEVSSWFLPERREELTPVPLSTHPCVYEDAEEFYSLEN